MPRRFVSAKYPITRMQNAKTIRTISLCIEALEVALLALKPNAPLFMKKHQAKAHNTGSRMYSKIWMNGKLVISGKMKAMQAANMIPNKIHWHTHDNNKRHKFFGAERFINYKSSLYLVNSHGLSRA
jgi:hypothetical protein